MATLDLKVVLVCLLGVLAIPSARAEFPIGTWSNGKDEFETIVIALRSDGRGSFTNVIGLTTIVKWWKEGDEIRIMIAAPPVNPTIAMKQAGGPRSATIEFPEEEPQLFESISDEEPPDFAAMAQEREVESWKNKEPDREEMILHNAEELRQIVLDFCDIAGPLDYLWISAEDWKSDIQITRSEVETFTISLRTESAEIEEPEGPIRYMPDREKPELEVDSKLLVPAAKIDALSEWAISRELRTGERLFVGSGPWGVVGYFSEFRISNIQTSEGAESAFEKAVGAVADRDADKVKVVKYTRKPRE